MRALPWFAIAVVAAGVNVAAAQQSPEVRKLFTFDSANVRFAESSPDGKWVVMSKAETGLAASIWIAASSGGAPIRLTSDGYNDIQPTFLASGDRIAFVSTRPNRNGGRSQYLMTLGVDPATGRAVGAPRQVSSEPVARGWPSSPDSRWIPYVTAGATGELKIVPTNGGMPKLLARVRGPVSGVTFSADGRYIVYTEQSAPVGAGCNASAGCSYTIRRVSVDGGASEEIATKPYLIQALPADHRYVLHRVEGNGSDGTRWELHDPSDRVVSRFQQPPGIAFRLNFGDGYGFVGLAAESERSIRVVSVDGGPLRTVTKSDRRWPEAWTADGSALLTDRLENGRIVVEVTPLSGSHGAQFTLPAGANSSGWQSSVGPWFSYQTDNPAGLYALNTLSGETKQLTKAVTRSHGSRGGREQDGSRWVYSEHSGNRVEFRSADPATGESMSIRTFTDGVVKRGHFISAGTRLAWFEVRGDSLDLMVAEGQTGAPRRVFSARWKMQDSDETIAWNWKGDRIAVCNTTSGTRKTVTILSIPTASTASVTRQEIPLPTYSQCWAPQWMPDDNGLVFLTIMDQKEDVPDLAYLPLRSGGELKVLTRDDPFEIWSFLLSPDGRSVAYPVDLPVSRTSIHTVSFKSLIDGKR